MSYFIGKSHFEEDGAQNCLVFQPIRRYFKINGKYIPSWKSKGLSVETITPYGTSDDSLAPLNDYYGRKLQEFIPNIHETITIDNVSHYLVN